jgi:predicted Zn-dependent peptidase
MRPTIRKEQLANGLSLLTESMPDVRSVSIGVWLKRGSRNESKRQNGISHFIEHLVFKGTEKRSAREIALAMDSVGGQMDAFTSKEYTCFYAKVLDEHLPVAVDLLADIVQRPLFDATELERERQVVLEEIRMVEDSPDELIYDLFSSHFYANHPLGRPIQGTPETVSAMTRRQLLSFFRSAYRPENLMIVAAGNLRHARMARLVRKAFGALEPGRPANGRLRAPRSRPGLVKRDKKELEQLHLLAAIPSFAENVERRYPLYVLNTILGGTMSSRLFQRIREERGLVYSVYSAVNAFVDSGFLTVYAATQPAAGREVIRLIEGELRDLRDNGPREDELRVAKEHLKGSLMLSLESTASRMSNLARQEIYFGRQLSLEETLAGVDGVETGDVHDLARDLMSGRELTVALVGRVGRFRLDRKGLKL